MLAQTVNQVILKKKPKWL